jgi:hypothetical protein
MEREATADHSVTRGLANPCPQRGDPPACSHQLPGSRDAALSDDRLSQRWVPPEQAAGIDFTSRRYYTDIQVGLDCGLAVWAHIEPGLGLYVDADLTAEQKTEAISKIEEFEDLLCALLGRDCHEDTKTRKA